MTTDAESDRKLLAAVKAGDRTALAELYDRHTSQMLGVAYRILNNRRDAEDLLHDVFLEAWQKAASYEAERGTVRNWLLLRVRSRAIDRVRTLSVAQSHAMAESITDYPQAPSHDEPSQAPDRLRACQALANLSEAQRLMVELGYFEGLTCREIAERCQIPVGTVKSRLSAAMAILRRELSNTQSGSNV